jgi:Protein of unknown function (DUF2778)
MTDATAAFYDVPRFDGRVVSFGDWRRIKKSIRSIAGAVVFGAGVVAATGLLAVTVTLAAAWIVNTSLFANFHINARAPTGPGTLALALDAPTLAGAPAVTFADSWARATASMQDRAVPLATPQTQVATLAPAAAPAAAPVSALPLPPRRPTEMAANVPLPRAYPAQREIGLSTVRLTRDQVAALAPPPPVEKRVAPLQEAHNRPMALPTPDNRTAVYDIAAHTVYLPNGERLEAHSGLGAKLDDPRYVKVRMHGPTPPNVYQLALREELFHGVRAIRLNPVDDDKMFGRAGMLAHTYMLGPNGQSNGCVSFKDYRKFLNAYLNGEVERLVVVAHLDNMPSRVVHERRGRAERYAANN